MKTADLTGRALDYAVALAEGYRFGRPVRCDYGVVFPVSVPGQATLSQAHLGPAEALHWACNVPAFCSGPAGDDIIDHEKISTAPIWKDADVWYWSARVALKSDIDLGPSSHGATRREAAMRAYVSSRLGEEVEIPEELR